MAQIVQFIVDIILMHTGLLFASCRRRIDECAATTPPPHQLTGQPALVRSIFPTALSAAMPIPIRGWLRTIISAVSLTTRCDN